MGRSRSFVARPDRLQLRGESRAPGKSAARRGGDGYDLVEAAKSGFEYRRDAARDTWTLAKKTQQPVLLVDPRAESSPEMSEVTRVFRLKPGLARYPISQEALNPLPTTYPSEGVESFDLETRSLLQALYFVSHGVDVPPEHIERQLVTTTRDKSGQPFDWRTVLSGLFRVASAAGSARPPGAQVAIPYRGYWYYIDERDQSSKATFSLPMELARLELVGRSGGGTVLTLPLSGR
jgi:hypothetical protein